MFRQLGNFSFVMALAYCVAAPSMVNAQSNVVYGNNNTFSYTAGFLQPARSGAQVTGGPVGLRYNNVGTGATVGITDHYARSGDGSVYFNLPSNAARADIELFNGQAGNTNNGTRALSSVTNATGSFGRLGDLTSLSYDWYRDSSSTGLAGVHTSIRIGIDRDGNLATTGDRGYLVFERAYNGGGVVTNQWVAEDLFSYNGGNGANFHTGGSWDGMTEAGIGYGRNLSSWMNGFAGTNVNGNSLIISFALTTGSGWGGLYRGAADNLSFGFNGNVTSYNFEAFPQAIPEPNSLILAGMAIMGMVATKGRRRRAA